MKKTLCIGVGNDWRGDDAIGLVLVRELKESQLEHIDFVESSGEVTEVLSLWKDYQQVVFIDAVHSNSRKAGELLWIHYNSAQAYEDTFRCSTHDNDLMLCLKIAESLGDLPEQVFLFGVVGENFTLGEPFSEGVKNSMGQVLAAVIQRLNTIQI